MNGKEPIEANFAEVTTARKLFQMVTQLPEALTKLEEDEIIWSTLDKVEI